MIFAEQYEGAWGPMTLAADEQGLVGAWFRGQRHYGELGSAARTLEDEGASPADADACPSAVRAKLDVARSWLDAYASGAEPAALPALHLIGSPFQRRVWELLLEIPYGKTTTYGALAAACEKRFGARTSARAVGGAVGRNPVSVIVPCHRVLGADGSITGYAGGTERKRALLALEASRRQVRRHEGSKL